MQASVWQKHLIERQCVSVWDQSICLVWLEEISNDLAWSMIQSKHTNSSATAITDVAAARMQLCACCAAGMPC